MKKAQQSQNINPLTPEYYIKQIKPNILESFETDQIDEIQRILTQAIPKPSPKIVDLRFTVDLILSRFYVVLFVGKERRIERRSYPVTRVTKFGNIVAACILLLGLNLLISTFIFLLLYLLKSALGINLFEGHLIDQIKKF